jgi:hypothetical protein
MESVMKLSSLHAVFVALLLTVASSYCAMECIVAPCHAKAAQPPCHQHQQPRHQEAPQDCLHSQLVMDTASTAAVSFDLAPLAILPVELTLLPELQQSQIAPPQEFSPPDSSQQSLSTVLRV